MDHNNIREIMSRWYSMWGNQLNITKFTSSDEKTSDYQVTFDVEEKKEEVKEKDDEKTCEKEEVENQPHHHLETSVQIGSTDQDLK